jgi:hypothetical protein
MKLGKGRDAGRKIKERCVLGAKMAWQCHVHDVFVTTETVRQQGSQLFCLSGYCSAVCFTFCSTMFLAMILLDARSIISSIKHQLRMDTELERILWRAG